MLHTALCDLLEIEHPIIQGGMGPNDTTDLAIAVCRAGGLGTISSSGADRAGDAYENTRRRIQRVKAATDSTFAVNQVIKGTEAQDRIRAVVDERRDDPEVRRRLKVVITSGGNPAAVAEALRESGVLHIQVVPTVYHARKAVDCGCGAVIAEGYESGGHVAYEPVHTMVLLPAVVDAVTVPVIAAGGFADGRGLAAALALGAAGHPDGHAVLSLPRGLPGRRLRPPGGPGRAVRGAGDRHPGRARRVRPEPPLAERPRRRAGPPGHAAGAPHEEIEHLKEEGLEAKLAGDLERAAVPIGMVVGRIDHLSPWRRSSRASSPMPSRRSRAYSSTWGVPSSDRVGAPAAAPSILTTHTLRERQMMDLKLAGKRALVTGASSGIGRAIALQLAVQEVHVAITARRAGLLEELAAEIRGNHVSAVVLPADATVPGAAEAVVAQARQQLQWLDVLVNSAGGSSSGGVLEVGDEGLGTKHSAQAARHGSLCPSGPAGPARPGGVIVNVVGGCGKLPAALSREQRW